MSFRFVLCDAFTDQPFGGNQLAVFPEASRIPERLLQPIARELGFSETTFIYAGEKPASSVSMRIFTPQAEVPFAGHPIIGSSFVLDAEGALGKAASELTFRLDGGDVPVLLQRDEGGTLKTATMTQQRPLFMGSFHHCDLVAQALGLEPADLAITGLPCEVVSTGLPFHIVPVGTLEAIRRIRINQPKMQEIARALGFGDLFVFTFETEDPEATVHCRMFAPSFGIPEDAATGSAAGCLGAYLVKNRAVPPGNPTRIVSEQGLEIGRPSRVFIEVDHSGPVVNTVRVGGSAVIVGEGSLDLDGT